MPRRKTAKKTTRRKPLSALAKEKSVFSGVMLRLQRAKSLRPGRIVFRLTGRGGGDYCLDCADKSVRLLRDAPQDEARPLIELICPKEAFEDIVAEGGDPLAQFQQGRFRVRGDIDYMVKLGLELGLIKPRS